MKSESPDTLIARLLDEERRADEAGAPDLARLLAEPRRRPEAGARAVRRFAFVAAALAAAVAAAIIVLRPAVRQGPTPGTAAIQLANWKAPTDVFLETSGADLWSRVPDLLSHEGALEAPTVNEPTKGVTP